MPSQLIAFIRGLEPWAKANEADARSDKIRFWSLKGPAILSSVVSAATAAASHIPSFVPVALGLIGSVCVAFDGLVRPGLLFKIHLKAFNEIRDLENSMQSRWSVALLEHKGSDAIAADILAAREVQRSRVAAYIAAAETANGAPEAS
ncbi:MAG: hypothetical protein ACRD1M_10410 [Terriglobales bacterium]